MYPYVIFWVDDYGNPHMLYSSNLNSTVYDLQTPLPIPFIRGSSRLRTAGCRDTAGTQLVRFHLQDDSIAHTQIIHK